MDLEIKVFKELFALRMFLKKTPDGEAHAKVIDYFGRYST